MYHDSGATDHIVNNTHLFLSSKTLSNAFVVLPNEHKAQVTDIGIVRINYSIVLKNVLFVPLFKVNLLSVSKLTNDSSCFITFSPHQCTFRTCTQGK